MSDDDKIKKFIHCASVYQNQICKKFCRYEHNDFLDPILNSAECAYNASKNQRTSTNSSNQNIKKYQHSVVIKNDEDDKEKTIIGVENSLSCGACQILEAEGELSNCIYHVKQCTKYGIEIRMILPELNRSMYFFFFYQE